MGVPFSDIKAMILAGFKSSFQPFHEKQAMLRRVASELDRYDDDGRLRPTTASAANSPGPTSPGATDRTTVRPSSTPARADAE